MSRAADLISQRLDELEAEVERLEFRQSAELERRRSSPRPDAPRESDPEAGFALTLGE